MIPNAVASTGPYAGLWSHLKSIDHALGRTLAMSGSDKLADLDRDRLRALAEFLRGGLSPGDHPSTNLVDYSNTLEPDYSAALDLRSRLKGVEKFAGWQNKTSFDKKLQRLISAIESLTEKSSVLFEKVPLEELDILRAMVQSLLSEAETALH